MYFSHSVQIFVPSCVFCTHVKATQQSTRRILYISLCYFVKPDGQCKYKRFACYIRNITQVMYTICKQYIIMCTCYHNTRVRICPNNDVSSEVLKFVEFKTWYTVHSYIIHHIDSTSRYIKSHDQLHKIVLLVDHISNMNNNKARTIPN